MHIVSGVFITGVFTILFIGTAGITILIFIILGGQCRFHGDGVTHIMAGVILTMVGVIRDMAGDTQVMAGDTIHRTIQVIRCIRFIPATEIMPTDNEDHPEPMLTEIKEVRQMEWRQILREEIKVEALN